MRYIKHGTGSKKKPIFLDYSFSKGDRIKYKTCKDHSNSEGSRQKVTHGGKVIYIHPKGYWLLIARGNKKGCYIPDTVMRQDWGCIEVSEEK